MDVTEKYEVWQDGMCVAKSEGPGYMAYLDAMHYAFVYGQDGPVKVYLVTPNRRVEVSQ